MLYPQGCKESDTTERLSGTPSPPVSISLFSMSVSLFLPCKQVHWHHFSRFHIHALIPSSFLFLIFSLG